MGFLSNALRLNVLMKRLTSELGSQHLEDFTLCWRGTTYHAGKPQHQQHQQQQHSVGGGDLSIADMLHDLSVDTDASSDIFPVAEDVAEVSKEEFLWSMKSGFEFVKYGRRGKPHKRFVWFDVDKSSICWQKCGKKKSGHSKRKTIKLHEIVDIVGGATTSVFARYKAVSKTKQNMCFSIVAQKRTLDLECATEHVRDFWMSRFYLLKVLQNEMYKSAD